MSTPETLDNISRQLNIYVGTCMFILGIIGCVWNILVFRHYSFRLSSCCIYMIFGSFASLVQLLFGLLPRILSDGFLFDRNSTNIAWCKIRSYVASCASLIALYCFVWSGIDRFFSTCQQIKWRYLTSVSIAKQICLLTIILWMIFNIPTLIYTRPLATTGTCASSSFIWSQISVYCLNLLCYGTFPWLLTSIFGILTLKNLRRVHQQRINPFPIPKLVRTTYLDHQLISMVLLQILLSMMSSTPFCIRIIYDNLTQTVVKTKYRRAQEDLCMQIVYLMFYLNYVSMFYVNYISSTVFRRLSKKVLTNLYEKDENISRGVTVINHQRSCLEGEARKETKIFSTFGPNTTSSV
ncbi:unnamed protein product [Adineta ricciae]|uniref:G-protein coupled receptors family 1 profile domain-containing protein n=1 Tax=Adineta ricciae TaxID=249248 RepID=A0A813XPT7_ADIRI|nr:unnamed protein product [Adineta ricciae]CAF1504423.1 unnamed protein product [Adineta ricciae]